MENPGFSFCGVSGPTVSSLHYAHLISIELENDGEVKSRQTQS